MSETAVGGRDWQLRNVPDELVQHYRRAGWWDERALTDLVADGLQRMSDVDFRVRSDVRPWSGRFIDVDRAARSLAAAWQADVQLGQGCLTFRTCARGARFAFPAHLDGGAMLGCGSRNATTLALWSSARISRQPPSRLRQPVQ